MVMPEIWMNTRTFSVTSVVMNIAILMSVPSEYEYFGSRNRGRFAGAPNYKKKKKKSVVCYKMALTIFLLSFHNLWRPIS
jgi:hypothetical protein